MYRKDAQPESLATASTGFDNYCFYGESIGAYGLFIGGAYGKNVNVYDANLAQTTATDLSMERYNSGHTHTKMYAMLAGGSAYSSDVTDSIDTYDTNLVHTISASPLSVRRKNMGCTNTDLYAVIAGGSNISSVSIKTVDAFDNNLTRNIATSLSTACQPKGFNAGNSANFLYGTTMYSYDKDLVLSTRAASLFNRSYYGVANLNGKSVFAGGYNTDSISNVDVCDEYLTWSSATNLVYPRRELAGATAGNCFIFAGGRYTTANATGVVVVDVYDGNMTRSIPKDLSMKRWNMAGVSVGDYALFAGGVGYELPSGVSVKDVEAYYYTSTTYKPIRFYLTKGSVYKEENGTETKVTENTIKDFDSPFSGYIKYKKGVIE